ncbi:MAG TPA: hypothetical protein VIM11_05965, partial [Tepidisphaeraceae bacterium]
MRPPILNPKVYLSPSGEFALTVDPSTMHGQGEASYRRRQKGREIWSGKRPFTLWEAAVTDQGVVAGYGYEYGPEGFPPRELEGGMAPGNFHVVILGPDGSPRLQAAVGRHESRQMHHLPEPLADGMVLDAMQRLLIVRISNEGRAGEVWWIYDLATGKELSRWEPAANDASLRFVIAARPIAGTPLILLNWWQYDAKSPKNPGAVFELVDLTDPVRPQPVWRETLPGDYFAANTPDDPWASDHLMNEIRDDGAILSTTRPARFEVRHVAANERVAFEVFPTIAPRGWDVRTVKRTPYMPATQPSGDELEIASINLKHLGTMRLGDQPAATTQPVHDVRAFDVDDRGRIGFIRDERGQTVGSTVVWVTAEGRTVAEGIHPAADFGGRGFGNMRIAWLGGDRWVVSDCDLGVEKTARAWFVDLDAGGMSKVTAIATFDCPAMESICGSGDGGFIVLAKQRFKYTMTDEVSRFDAQGVRKWRVSGSDPGNDLFFPQDLAVDRAHSSAVVALDNINKRLQYFDVAGHPTRQIDLIKAFGREPNYPTKVNVERDGGPLIYDFNGSPSMWRL